MTMIFKNTLRKITDPTHELRLKMIQRDLDETPDEGKVFGIGTSLHIHEDHAIYNRGTKAWTIESGVLGEPPIDYHYPDLLERFGSAAHALAHDDRYMPVLAETVEAQFEGKDLEFSYDVIATRHALLAVAWQPDEVRDAVSSAAAVIGFFFATGNNHLDLKALAATEACANALVNMSHYRPSERQELQIFLTAA